jgi:hypothetical protein
MGGRALHFLGGVPYTFENSCNHKDS